MQIYNNPMGSLRAGYTADQVVRLIRKSKNQANIEGQARFGIRGVLSYGMTKPQMKTLARRIGKNHDLALALWKTKIHEARHIAAMIADPARVTEPMMERWVRDFDAWDIVDDCCSVLFCRTPFAYRKAMAWSRRTREYEKRAGFALMAFLAVHDKVAPDDRFDRFLNRIEQESSDGRNFVRKAVNWALRQIGKRNPRLCNKAIASARRIRAKDDTASRWVAADALRELIRYRSEGRIKNIGTPGVQRS
jgi:3-methyladenine DNA glycosylase AlkD